MSDTEIRVHDPSARRAEPAQAPPRGALWLAAEGLGALRRWWAAGRRYRPERRYMRGGDKQAGARALARR